jgi:hypothetical protein
MTSSKKVLMEVMVFEALKTKSHNFMLQAKQETLIEARQGEPASQPASSSLTAVVPSTSFWLCFFRQNLATKLM